MPKLLNINQLCEAARMSRRTVYRHVENKTLPAPRKVRGAALWDVKTVREALARRGRLLLA